jgi:hypothetical protein
MEKYVRREAIRASLACATRIALAAAIVATFGAGAGAASAGAATIPAECSNLQSTIDHVVAVEPKDGEGDVIALNGLCDATNLKSSTGVTLPAGSNFSIEGKLGTTSGFDGAGIAGPLLSNATSTEAGAMTISHLTFEHAKDFSALSIRASRVTLSGDSFLENEEQGASEHAAFVEIGPCPPTGTPAITITGSTFSSNKLILGNNKGGGAGAWLEDACDSRNVLEGNTFEGNTLEAENTDAAEELEVTGGGLQFVGGKTQPASVSQRANVFDSNRIVAPETAALGDYGGGGEWLADASLLSVDDRFSRNDLAGTRVEGPDSSAWSWGAGLGLDNRNLACNGAELTESTLEDAVVVGNAIGSGTKIDLGGGGIWVSCSHLRVLNSTVTLNTAPYGAGIEGEAYDQLELANSIVAEDSPGEEIAGFAESEGGSLTASFSDVCATAGSSEPLPGAGNICANPLLTDNGNPVSFDVHETASSPTIDAGSNALVPSGLTTDFFGMPRILAGRTGCMGSFPAMVDMGAAELQPAVPSCPETAQEQTPATGPATSNTGLTASAPATDPTVDKQAPAPGLTHFVSLKLSSTGVSLRLSCSSADGKGCSGAIYVTSNETLQGKKVVAVGASNRTKAPVRIGQASFSMAAGATVTYQVKLNSTGLTLLRHFHAFSAWVLANEVMPSDSQVIFFLHDARFSEPKQKHKPKNTKSKKHHG